MDDYDRAYRASESLFGDSHEPILERFVDQIDSTKPVLDLGAGQGRNALFLARRGLSVHAVDPSQVALQTIEERAAVGGLRLDLRRGGLEDLDAPLHSYAAVLVFGLIQILDREGIALLGRRLLEGTAKGGLVFVTAFTTEDEGFRKRSSSWDLVGEGSFRGPDGEVRTYLEPGEGARIFPGLEPIHCWEGLGAEHRHGDGPLERHAMVEAVYVRRDA